MKAFYPFVFNKKLTRKIDMLRISLKPAVRLLSAHIDGLVKTTPECSQLKDLKTGVIDESHSDMDTLLIADMYFLCLLK